MVDPESLFNILLEKVLVAPFIKLWFVVVCGADFFYPKNEVSFSNFSLVAIN